MVNPIRFTENDRQQLRELGSRLINSGEPAEVLWGKGEEGGSWFAVFVKGEKTTRLVIMREPTGEYLRVDRGSVTARGQTLSEVLPEQPLR